jgi:hypothetical protein
MDTDNAIIDLATTPQPLPCRSDSMHAALSRPRFVQAANGLLVSMFLGHQLLTLVPHTGFIPLDRFHEAL